MKSMVGLVIGVILLVSALITMLGKTRFLRRAATAEGIVVSLNAGGSHPEVEFTTATGKKVSYPQGGFIFGFKPGDPVRVRYLSDDPERSACVDRVGALWFAPGFMGVLGLIFFGVGLHGMRRDRNNRRAPRRDAAENERSR